MLQIGNVMPILGNIFFYPARICIALSFTPLLAFHLEKFLYFVNNCSKTKLLDDFTHRQRELQGKLSLLGTRLKVSQFTAAYIQKLMTAFVIRRPTCGSYYLTKGFLCVRHILEVIICPLGLRNWDLPENFRRVKIKVFHSFFLLFLPFIFYFSLISLHFYQRGSMSTMLKKFDLDVIFQTTYYDTRSKLILEIFCWRHNRSNWWLLVTKKVSYFRLPRFSLALKRGKLFSPFNSPQTSFAIFLNY